MTDLIQSLLGFWQSHVIYGFAPNTTGKEQFKCSRELKYMNIDGSCKSIQKGI